MYYPTDGQHFRQKLDHALRELHCCPGSRLKTELLEPFRQAWLDACAAEDGKASPSEVAVLEKVLAQLCHGVDAPIDWMIRYLANGCR